MLAVIFFKYDIVNCVFGTTGRLLCGHTDKIQLSEQT